MEPPVESQSATSCPDNTKGPISRAHFLRVERIKGNIYLTFGLDHDKRMTFRVAPEVALLDCLAAAEMGRKELLEQGRSRRDACQRLIAQARHSAISSESNGTGSRG